MNLGTLAQKMAVRMVKIAGDGAKLVTFRFVTSDGYDPETGTTNPVYTEASALALVGGFTEQEIRDGTRLKSDLCVRVPTASLTSDPSTASVLIIAGVNYQVHEADTDLMQGFHVLCARRM